MTERTRDTYNSADGGRPMDDGIFYSSAIRSDAAARFVRAANWPGFMVGKRPPNPTELLAELVEAAPEYDTGDCVFCGLPGGHDNGCLIIRAQRALEEASDG